MSLNPRYKLVLRPEFPTIDGVRSLNGLPEQPFVDNSGNIDMSANFLLVKNIEAGTQDFTTNTEKGIINVYSDSTTNGVSCINFKHNRNNMGGNTRRYCSFQPRNTNFIAGSITGNPATVSYNTTSDLRLKTNIKNIGSVNNDSSEKYSIGSDISFNTWLGAVSQLKPRIFEYNTDIVGSGNNHFTYKKTTDGDNISVNYQGFIAGEVQEVYPPAVTGISGEIVDSNPVYQQLDVTKLIPMMVGSIQELMTRPSGGLSVPDGILDISGDILRVKNIEAGTQDFTVNDNNTPDNNKGVINVFSDSSANNVANINLKNTNTNIALYQNGNNRSYTEFQTVVNASNITSGIISGDNFQTVYGSLMDQNLMQLCDSQFGTNSTNQEYETGKYSVPDRKSVFYIGENSGSIEYDTWLDQINALNPSTYFYKTTTTSNGQFNAAYRQGPNSPYHSNAYVPYQGFLGSNVLNVYPPAVINSSPDSSNNMYVDMSKLVPMCIGAIKQLDASNNSLTSDLAGANTTIQDLSGNLATINTDIQDLSGNLAGANMKIVDLSGNLAVANTKITNLTTDLTSANIIISNMYRDLYGSDSVLSTLNYNWHKVPSSLYTSNTICKTIPIASRRGYLSEFYLTANKSEYNNWYFTPTSQLNNTDGYNILLDLSNNQATESIADLIGVEFIYSITQISVYINEHDYTEITYDYNYYQIGVSGENYIIQDLSKNAYHPTGEFDIMIGVISNLPYTSDQTLAELNFNWELVNKSKTILPQYTIAKTIPWNGHYDELRADGGHSFRHFVENINRLTSVRWGASQSNSLLSENARKTILATQLTDISNNGLLADISGVQFVYDISYANVPREWYPIPDLYYTYKYYTFENNILDFSSNSAYEDSNVGVFGVIYDISL